MKATLTKDIKSQGRVTLAKGAVRDVIKASRHVVLVEASPQRFIHVGKDECVLSD
jgi:hypothetical protein